MSDVTMYVDLAVGPTKIAWAVVTNLGHVHGAGTHAPDDLCRYRYDVMILGAHVDDCPSGEILHRRSDGAWRLTHAILTDCLDDLPTA